MRRTTSLWIAMPALCVTGSIYEFPNAVSSLRRIRNAFSGPSRSPTSLVSDRLLAQDPEAGDVLRYVIEDRYSDPNVSELRGLVAAMYWAAALVALDVWNAQCACEHQIPANPLSAYGQLPAATQQTYERYIRDGGPLDDLEEDGAYALPEHIRYFTPQDMEAFLAKRQTEGKALSEEQLRSVLWRSARDVRPILQAMIDSSNAPETVVEQIDERETPQ